MRSGSVGALNCIQQQGFQTHWPDDLFIGFSANLTYGVMHDKERADRMLTFVCPTQLLILYFMPVQLFVLLPGGAPARNVRPAQNLPKRGKPFNLF